MLWNIDLYMYSLFYIFIQMAVVMGAEVIPSIDEINQYVAPEKHLLVEQQDHHKAKSKFRSGTPNDPFSESVGMHIYIFCRNKIDFQYS